MSAALLIGVGVLGGLGSVARFAVDRGVAQRLASGFPYGMLAVNASGSFALGVLVGAGVGHDALRLLGVGLIGGYTTFSTWMLETHRLADEGRLASILNVGISIALGLAVVWAGRELGMVL